MITNEKKTYEICWQMAKKNGKPFGGDAFIAIMQMAKWKDTQQIERINEILDIIMVSDSPKDTANELRKLVNGNLWDDIKKSIKNAIKK